MFRRARWLILLAIGVLIFAVSTVYIAQRRLIKSQAPPKAEPLPPNVSATAQGWTYTKSEGDKVLFRVRAKNYQQVKEPSTFLLTGLELEIHGKDPAKIDLVKTDRATFDTAAGSLFAEGTVEITLGVPVEGAMKGRPVTIHSSKMNYDSKTTRVFTEEHTTFSTDRGDGEAIGADYDPVSRELHLHKEVKLHWRGQPADKKTTPRVMNVEAGELVYKETENHILLFPWARLTRETLVLEGNDSVVFLKDGLIDRVECHNARGSDRKPARELEYGGDFLTMNFTPKGQVTKVEALENARLANLAATARTTVTGKRIDLEFDPGEDESQLRKAWASGGSRVESKPVERAGAPLGPTRVLTSDVIELNMRNGGEEIDQVATHSAGQIDFVPNRVGEKKRTLNGDRLYFQYGPKNALEKFRAVKVTTRTETPAVEKGKPATVAITQSTDMQADFDTQSGQMIRMEQWPDFQYEEGQRTAKAQRATLDQTRNQITLKTTARMADQTGSTSADEIVLDQATGDFFANGNVSSIRLPEKSKSGANQQNGMLKGDEPLQARAEQMVSAEQNQRIVYEGGAVLWQGANRLQGQRVTIQRGAGELQAVGNVVSQFPDQSTGSQKDGVRPGKTSSVFTVIRSGQLDYSDKEKLAHYRTNVVLERPGLEVKSKELRAWFREEKTESGTESSLDRIFVDGAVDIVDRSPERTRRGSAEHSEYYLEDERIVLTAGNPVVNDSKRGVARGNLITWFSRQDKLVVESGGAGRAVSRLPKK